MNSFEGQVAGHGNIFTSADENTSDQVFKKLDTREYMFYRSVTASRSDLRLVAPAFHGVYTTDASGTFTSVPLDKVDARAAPHRAAKGAALPGLFIALDDATRGMRLPCVMDVKLGRREHDLWAPPAKAAQLTERCAATTSRAAAVRYCGHVAYVRAAAFAPENAFQTVAEAEPGLWRLAESKYYGRGVREHELADTFARFFRYPDLEPRPDVVAALLPQLREIARILRAQSEFTLWSTSLLIVYDAADPRGAARAYVIDFAHAIDASVTGADGDADAAAGVERIIACLEATPHAVR